MRSGSYLILLALTFLVLAMFFHVNSVDGLPGRGGSRGGGGRKSGGGWFSSKPKNKGYGGYGSSGGSSVYKKSSKMKTLKKAAVIGAVAYGSYQLGKLSAGYSSWGWGRSHGYGFNDWNRWREIDGFLCRNNEDCNWIDRALYCQDYELDFQPSALWFGGDVARIVGECACPYGQVFDDREMRCETNYFSGTNLLLVVLIPLVVLCCCCCCAVVIVRKLFC